MNKFNKIVCKKHTNVLLYLFLFITTFSVYVNVIHFSFINYDDTWYVTANQYVQNGLTLSGVNWSLTAIYAANWHPLTWMSHMLDVTLYGMNPGGHHLTNLLLHIANTLLLFSIFKRMSTNLWRSAFIAALFALHPLHVESVAWIAERKDVLCTFFMMLAIWSYIRYTERPEIGRYFMIVLFFTFSLMSKAMSVTFPFILLLLDFWPLNRIYQRQQTDYSESTSYRIFPQIIFRLVYEKIPFFVLSAMACFMTYFVQNNSGTVNPLKLLSIDQRVGNALVSYFDYIWKMLYPFELSIFYPHPGAIGTWKLLTAILFLTVISYVIIKYRKTHPYLIVGWFWYLGTLIPVIGFVQVGSQAMADRYTYIPHIGLFIIITWQLSSLINLLRNKQTWCIIIGGIIIIYLMAGTWFQVRYWQNSITLFSHAIKITSYNFLAHNNIGNALIAQGSLNKAIDHYNKALKINPHFIVPQKNLENALKIKAKIDGAVEEMYAAMENRPLEQPVYYQIDRLKRSKILLDIAIADYRKILTYQPAYQKERFNVKNLTQVYQALQDYKKHITK